jgi:lysophospholipase L1-like esterase
MFEKNKSGTGKKIVLSVLIAVLLGIGVGVYTFRAMGRVEYWESTIRKFEQSDRIHPPRPGVIVFTGSSSIRFWDTLVEDMKPLDVVNRGFGGSQIADVNYYAHRIVTVYRPRAVVLYAGSNDLLLGKSPSEVRDDFKRFVEIIHAEMPETWIYFVSIKPTTLFRFKWPATKETNRLIEEFSRTQHRVEFIDVSSALLDAQGKPRPGYLKWDGLHPNRKCYDLMTSIIKPILIKRFAVKERDVGRSETTSRNGFDQKLQDARRVLKFGRQQSRKKANIALC